MIFILVLGLLGLPMLHGYSGPVRDPCYVHYDHTAKYQLRNHMTSYPMKEINLILQKHPEMRSMFYEDNLPIPATSSHFDPEPQAACPYDRYTLYSFFYAGKDCYVIYPDVQKIMFVQCRNDSNRDCQTCSWSGAGYGGVNKCEEDYDYRYVWAYCSHRHHHPNPRPPVIQTRDPYPRPPVIQSRDPYPRPPVIQTRDPYPRPPVTQTLPTLILKEKPSVYREYPANRGWGAPKPKAKTHHVSPGSSSKTYVSAVYSPDKMTRPLGSLYRDPWNTMYRPHHLQYRWKRSVLTTEPQGTIERMRLYLPHSCGCKRFKC